MRPENIVFEELENVCVQSGFVHAIAYLCWRDFTLVVDDELCTDDVLPLYDRNRIIKSELAALIGLTVKGPIDQSFPGPDALQNMIDDAQRLLNELHDSLASTLRDNFTKKSNSDKSGIVWREPIIYGGDSAFSSQYRDFSPIRYEKDKTWLNTTKGFNIDDAVSMAHAFSYLQQQKMMEWYKNFTEEDIDTVTPLQCFCVTYTELKSTTGFSERKLTALLDAFSIDSGHTNSEFQNISDYNKSNAFPIIKLSADTYLLFTTFTLYESIYESPFFWFLQDKEYKPTGEANRGLFTESYAAQRLNQVFGEANVHKNVEIYQNQKRLGEVDVLVAFGDRLIIVQAKSKKLTIAARKGDGAKLHTDFKSAVQDAYDQGLSCGSLIQNPELEILSEDKSHIDLNRQPKAIYIFTIVAEHYPALSFQAREFLKYQTNQVIREPLISDIFLLDIMCEFLDSPARFIDYLDRRARLHDRISAGQELTVLSYHLTQNLWIEDKVDYVQLGEDISADIEQAMLVRREGLPGNPNLKDAPTLFETTFWAEIFDTLKNDNNPKSLDVSCKLLELSGYSIEQMNEAVEELYKACNSDGMHHDFTMAFKADGGFGLSIHCNDNPIDTAQANLKKLSLRRKYKERATVWCGVCISPSSRKIRFIQPHSSTWEYSQDFESQMKLLKPATRTGRIGTMKFSIPKVGRNDSCPCGSRKKFKKCCMLGQD